MRRRSFLALCGVATAGLAGCSQSPQQAESSPAPTTTESNDGATVDSTTRSTTASQTPSLTAEVDALQPAVVTQATADSIDVRSGETAQFLYLNVRATAGDPPERDALRLRFDDELHAPAARDRPLWRTSDDPTARYSATSGRGWVLFELPATGDASDLALVHAESGGEYPVASAPSHNVDGRLAAPSPSLSLDLSVADAVEQGATPTLSFTVTNDGSRDATFVGALNRSGPRVPVTPVAAVTERVPPGEPTSFEVTDSVAVDAPSDEVGDGEPDLHYDLYWTGGSEQRRLRVVEDSDGN